VTTAKAKKFQELREAQGISADELSRRMGVDAATVRRWESGEEEPDEGTLNQMLDTLGASQDAVRHKGNARHHDHD
jgi:transcriptional regulator with XRE-family HTH domain